MAHQVWNRTDSDYMKPNSQTKRIAYIDTTKAICIFLMIVGHWNSNELLSDYIYSFHMPAFFVVTGYLYRPHAWFKTLMAYTIPIMVYSIINCLIQIGLGTISISSITFPDIIRNVFQYRYGLGESLFNGIWFLWALLALRFLFGDIKLLKGLRRHYLLIALAAAIYMTFEYRLISIDTLFRGYYIGRLIPCLPFFCFGLYLKDTKWTPQLIANIKYIIPLTFSFMVMPVVNGRCDIYSNIYGYSYFIAMTNALLTTLLLFWTTFKIPANKFIETISKGTLVILGMHMPLLRVLDKLLPQRISFFFPFIVIVLCYYITLFCERYCPILLGKIKH